MQSFPASREAGLERLEDFVPRAGGHYARMRNYDFGPERRDNVSLLSPYLRHRLIEEREAIAAVLDKFAPSTAEKFVQEVFWRTYFKGWLEMRPEAWRRYRAEVDRQVEVLDGDGELAGRYAAAVEGRTGIEGFDDWARELVETGYLHNHARMWTASIWIFTLDLPWTLGADFFLRHLVDGDPASNTLSWRWVAGLHTKGKNYVARESNIAKYTDERFRPRHRLTPNPEPLDEAEEMPRPVPPPPAAEKAPAGPLALLLTEDDLHPEGLTRPGPGGGRVPLDPEAIAAVAALRVTGRRSPLEIGEPAAAFAAGAVADGLSRAAERFETAGVREEAFSDPAAVAAWAKDIGTETVVTPYAPVGPAAEALGEVEALLSRQGQTLVRLRRDWDEAAWPHATKGYFAFKKNIPKLLARAGLA